MARFLRAFSSLSIASWYVRLARPVIAHDQTKLLHKIILSKKSLKKMINECTLMMNYVKWRTRLRILNKRDSRRTCCCTCILWSFHTWVNQKVNLLVITEYFICQFTVKYFFIWTEVGWWFDSVKWLSPKKRHLEFFWRETQRTCSTIFYKTTWEQIVSCEIQWKVNWNHHRQWTSSRKWKL